MSDKPVPLLAIRRNPDGTWSVLNKRKGIRLVKAGFTSHAEAEQWCEERRLEELKRGAKKSAAVPASVGVVFAAEHEQGDGERIHADGEDRSKQ